MKNLTDFILERIVDKKSYTIDEIQENGRVVIEVKADPSVIGLLIGKGGNTIKAIQTILRVKGKLENTPVSITITEK